ncbi:MAG: ArsR family transcriptional regulator [Chloroflexi bacterium]|nr:MAG: ArsR family transcriptional regulator [Chloroflexota bacterium]MBL1194789.1 ArsR family transcriptional regulator [Chloroflexota bacterium]NOH12081.1 winged helix-turn-helix transcriptional regulator [Chloroflexota bacterium]
MVTLSPFRAIGDPTRRAILDILREDGPQRAGELAKRIPSISRPAVSKHLRILRQSTLVAQQHKGRERWYQINPAALKEVQAWVQRYESYWQDNLLNLKEIVESQID